MAEIIVATLTIDFTSDEEAQGSLMLEEIGEDDGGIKGDYVMYKGNVEVLEHGAVGGVIVSDGKFTKDISEYVTFSNSQTTSLPYPISVDEEGKVSALTLTQIGKQYKIDKKTGAVTEIPDNAKLVPTLLEDNTTLKVSVNALAIFKAEYKAIGDRYCVSSSLPIAMVYAVGKVN